MSRIFLDTNVLVYSVDDRDVTKQAKAIGLITTCLRDRNGVISTQVLQEFAAVSLAKLHHDPATIIQEIAALESLEVVQVAPFLIRRGLELCRLYQIAYWDSTILAAAEQAKCDRLWSEDFSTGAKYGSLVVENPLTGT